ncbi:MAG: hypothetical protein GWN58_14665, partial [Anaerolineae bacterium]|nr:hypothetical protein [Anaerolineae bacterium]
MSGWTNGALPDQTSSGFSDAFVRKYDSHGNELWTRQFGNGWTVIAFGISVDASGVYVGGRTSGALPGQTSTGFDDAFVRKYDANGNVLWTRQLGTTKIDRAFEVSVDASGVYVVGETDGALPGQTSSGGFQAFVVKLSVVSALELLQRLIADVVALNLQQGISNSLDSKLDAAVEALDDLKENNDVAAINALQAFIN